MAKLTTGTNDPCDWGKPADQSKLPTTLFAVAARHGPLTFMVGHNDDLGCVELSFHYQGCEITLPIVSAAQFLAMTTWLQGWASRQRPGGAT